MNKEDIEKIAELSKLFIDENQKDKLIKEMEEIITFTDKLSEYNGEKNERKWYDN